MSITSEIAKKTLVAGIVTVVLFASATAAQASLLADFLPQPASLDMPEFVWDGVHLTSGSGAIGTNFDAPGAGDGEELLENQDMPGLQIVTPFVIGGLPGGVTNVSAGSTTFYDVTLKLTQALTVVSPVSTVAGFYVVQELSDGEVELWSTDPADPGVDDENPILLLSGTINSAMIAGILHSDTGAVLSADIVYSGGAIYDAALMDFGASSLEGSFSWSLLNITEPLSVTGGVLDGFVANGTGQFSGVPEPATMTLLAIGACMMTIRRRRRA